jgi:transcriptional regulator with XRE-family HTH domain
LDQVSTIIADQVKKKGKTKSEVADKLGISSQLLGQYTNGRQKPKPDFYIKWKNAFGEDILTLIELKGAEDKKITIDYEIESMVKDLLQVKAQVKTLLNHIARLEAREYKMEPDDVWDLLEADTKTNLRDLTRGS